MFDIIFGRGISKEGEILDLGEELGILSKKGSWYQWDGQALGQGRESARRFLTEHHDTAQQIEKCILSRARPSFRIEETAEYRVDTPDEQPESGDNHQDASVAATAELFDAEDQRST
jgi:recombination protein RecA